MNKDYPYTDNTVADIRLIGHPNELIPFAQHISSPRVNMVNHHLGQAMVIAQPEFNKIFTGAEQGFVKHSFNNSRREFDCEIVKIIPKYQPSFIKGGIDNCPEVYVIVLTFETQPNGETIRKLDYFTINRYFMGTNGFGWIPIENLGRIREGEILDKETTITHSPAVKGSKYCIGTNLNIIYGSFPETIEDAFIISESAAAKLETTQVSKVVINCRQDRRPLNLNGDETEDKFLPDIGSVVRPDGMLCGFRPVHWTSCVADSDPRALREPLVLQDDIIYVEPGAKIVDLTFNINRSKINDCYDQPERYMRNNTMCHETIYATYLKYKDKYLLSDKMSTLVTTSIYRMIAQGSAVRTLEANFRKEMRSFDIEGDGGQPVDFLQAIVHYTVPRKVSNGDKLTDLSGSKGVVGKVIPDDWMPVDEFGIRADMWIDMNSPVARNNPSQFYETGINRISEFVRRKCEAIRVSQGTEAAFDTLMDWYNDVNPNYARLIRGSAVSSKSKKDIVSDAIMTSPKIWILPYLDKLCPAPGRFWNGLENIKAWADKWGVVSTPVRYKIQQSDGSLKEFVTEAKFAIGSKYIIRLHKIPEITAPGPASVNHIGIPTKPTFTVKHFPVSTSPYRYGEDELRVIAIDTDVRVVSRFQNMMSNSPVGVTAVINALLTSEHPTQIKYVPISNGELMRTSAVLRLFHNISATLGVETKNTKIDQLDIPDELMDSIWQADVVDYGTNPPSSDEDDEDRLTKRSTAKRNKMKKMIDAISEPVEVTIPDEDEEETESEDEIV